GGGVRAAQAVRLLSGVPLDDGAVGEGEDLLRRLPVGADANGAADFEQPGLALDHRVSHGFGGLADDGDAAYVLGHCAYPVGPREGLSPSATADHDPVAPGVRVRRGPLAPSGVLPLGTLVGLAVAGPPALAVEGAGGLRDLAEHLQRLLLRSRGPVCELPEVLQVNHVRSSTAGSARCTRWLRRSARHEPLHGGAPCRTRTLPRIGASLPQYGRCTTLP